MSTTMASRRTRQASNATRNVASRWPDRIIQGALLLFLAALPLSIFVSQTALALAFSGWIAKMAVHRRGLVPRTALDVFFLAYVAAELLSLAFSVDRWNALVYAKRLLLIPIVYLVAHSLSSERWARLSIVTLVGTMALLGTWGSFKYLAGPGGLGGRLHMQQHTMTSGGLLMMGAVFALAGAAPWAPRRVRLAALLAAVPIVAAMVFTYTRSAWIGFAAAVLTMGFWADRRWIGALLTGAALLVALGGPEMRDRALSSFDPHHPRNLQRTYMWRSGLSMIRERPWTGFGDVDFKEIYPRYMLPEASEKVGHLHNNWIMLGVTLGIPGLLVVSLLFGAILVVEWRILRRARHAGWFPRSMALASLGCFVGFQLSGLFEWNFGDAEVVMLLWFSVGLALAMDARMRATTDSFQNEQAISRLPAHSDNE
jgi:O-antigen ligase